MEKKSDITQTIRQLSYDFKAEAVVADLMQNGLDSEDFIVIPAGIFKRRYSRDINGTGRVKLKNGTDLAGIYLNRDAIYNNLPEGFFHQSTDHAEDSKNGAHHSKKLKEEEKAARNFFLPFENEIFTQRINLESEERQILTHFSENLSDDFSPEFWKIDRSIDRKYLAGMVRFMHVSHKIAGNPKLTAQCLEVILQEQVKATQFKKCVAVKGKRLLGRHKRKNLLGSGRLGVDFICGEKFLTTIHAVKFEIGPLQNSSVGDYLKTGKIAAFLKCFFGYFVPAGTVVAIRVLVAADKQGFTLDPAGEGILLGYHTAI